MDGTPRPRVGTRTVVFVSVVFPPNDLSLPSSCVLIFHPSSPSMSSLLFCEQMYNQVDLSFQSFYVIFHTLEVL